MELIAGFLAQAVGEKGYGNDYAGFYRQHAVLNYITARLSAGLRVSQVAQALGIPRHILSRSFRQDTGIGLKDYMEQLLLQEIKKRMLTTKQPLCQIAEELDFCDAYYLSRFFRKYEQISPREYRPGVVRIFFFMPPYASISIHFFIPEEPQEKPNFS